MGEKWWLAVLLCVLSAQGFARERLLLSSLPPCTNADSEVSTNLTLNVDAVRLKQLSFTVSCESCETNEVLIALGTDSMNTGDLSFADASLVFGCDCGVWYLADLRTGEACSLATNVLELGRHTFDASWNLAKVIWRGGGIFNGNVRIDEERVRFDVRIR